VKRTALAADELVTAVHVRRAAGADVREGRVAERDGDATCSLAVVVDTAAGEVRAAFGSAAVTAKLVTVPLALAADLPDRVAEAPCRSTTSAPAPRTGATPPCARGPRAREMPALVRIALTVNGEPSKATPGAARACSPSSATRSSFPARRSGEQGECGSCSVLLDGALVCACLVLAAQAEGHDVVTVEGLSANAALHPVQQAFVDAGAVQCGFCTPGLVVAVADLLARTPHPTDDEIRESLSGNLCRCTGYVKIFDAVRLAVGSA
jgi:carbon-monoxide dehydrogenase small subunit